MKRGQNTDRKRYGKNKFIPHLIIIVSVLLVVVVASIITVKVVSHRIHTSDSVAALYDSWNVYDYQKVYEISGNILASNPLHNAARTFHGYSSFYLAVSENDNSKAQGYLDEAINNIRIALIDAKYETKGQLEYMLGKTYFYKNNLSSYHYYADLVVLYLVAAQNDGYKSDDMAEYLGLSYAQLGDTERSIASFTEALLYRESDTLLLSIAEQYYRNEQYSASKQYLYRISGMSNDDEILNRTHNLMGKIYTQEGDFQEAKKEFEAILEKNENSADAHYGLGVLYEKQGDMAKARSEWRKTLRIQATHEGALKKMSETK